MMRGKGSQNLCRYENSYWGKDRYISFAVDGLKVSRTSGLDAEWINIPKAYTKVDIPVDSIEIATPEKMKKWKYLQEISEEIS